MKKMEEGTQMKKVVRKGNYEGGCSLKKEVEVGCSCCKRGVGVGCS